MNLEVMRLITPTGVNRNVENVLQDLRQVYYILNHHKG